MPTFTIEALVDRARVYIADDHDDQGGFLSTAAWVALANAQYAEEYRDMVRLGIISPAPTDTAFTSYTTSVNSVLATIGVAEDLGSGQMRVIDPFQSAYGRKMWGYTEGGTPIAWTAHATGDTVTYTLEPRTTGSYVVRTIAVPSAFSTLASTVDLPFGSDEHFVLGLARRAKLKDGSASAHLERLYAESTAQRNMYHHGRINSDAPRVRKVVPTTRQWTTDPRMWRYH